MTNILLASTSARRRELIQLTGWEITVTATEVDEEPVSGEAPGEHVLRLARDKASSAMALNPGKLILTADTIVVDGGVIFGKPVNTRDAVRILRTLRGHSHFVKTAIALYDPQAGQLSTDICESVVPMRNYSDYEILRYVETNDPLDKAGAYAIQNRTFHPVENFSGCFASVMGMPLCHLERTARKMNIDILPGLQDRCQQALGYQCSIFDEILRDDIIS